jgi:hypothetical protein
MRSGCPANAKTQLQDQIYFRDSSPAALIVELLYLYVYL